MVAAPAFAGSSSVCLPPLELHAARASTAADPAASKDIRNLCVIWFCLSPPRRGVGAGMSVGRGLSALIPPRATWRVSATRTAFKASQTVCGAGAGTDQAGWG
ncbi:hypothetical protein Asi02nite_72620 [Asanoa siamensis]|uniref:Secreted protein n=1 Tax=Asanoa siamensis TaxID=926357 RepID=A0ABQ4D2H8_9ACTN|nr:hypothetical protein Asi02nite_72620 [Asanoa siamensis]